MDKEELDLLEIVFTLAIGECAYNDINNIQKLEDKIKTINNLCKKQKEVINKVTNELFILKNMIYKPETREENFEIQRKISSIIKRLNGKEVAERNMNYQVLN